MRAQQGPQLSAAAVSVWAKHDAETGGWLPLYQHMADSADVAELLWDEWLPGNVKSAISNAVGGADVGRRVFCWLTGAHDIGKAAPTFAEKVPDLAGRMSREGLRLLPGDNSDHGQHWSMGHVVLVRWLKRHYEFSVRTAEAFGCVLGGHHGNPPDASVLQVFERGPWLGDAAWAAVREELLAWITARQGMVEVLPGMSGAVISRPIQVLLSAGVIVADWIASNTDFFPLVGPSGGVKTERAQLAWERLGLTAPWEPSAPLRDPAELLQQRFPWLRRPRPLQAAVIEQAWQVSEPSLMLIEAPMGEGKTEAALAAAEVLAYRFDCGGALIALPTMATTDAMFGRVKAWIEALPDDRDFSTYLAHSKAGLNDEYSALPRIGSIHGVYDDEAQDGLAGAEAVAHSWLSGRKKGVLATFVVATIDQVLFGALKSRHLALRHLALAGKVVVIDEVHAADDYMRAYLCRVLQWLAAYRVPVVLLSATLPPAQREQLVAAYEAGLPRADLGEHEEVDLDALFYG